MPLDHLLILHNRKLLWVPQASLLSNNKFLVAHLHLQLKTYPIMIKKTLNHRISHLSPPQFLLRYSRRLLQLTCWAIHPTWISQLKNKMRYLKNRKRRWKKSWLRRKRKKIKLKRIKIKKINEEMHKCNVYLVS